jgi:hypothetical protein
VVRRQRLHRDVGKFLVDQLALGRGDLVVVVRDARDAGHRRRCVPDARRG